MKKVYFVRHGESEGNIGPVRQGPAAPLTEKGRQQAVFIAERCVLLPIEFVVSSTMKRAQETTAIIIGKLNKSAEYSELFVERRRPKEQVGAAKGDAKALEVEKIIRKNFTHPDFRFSDEENFEDLKLRAREALRYLEHRAEKEILVITHGYFMRVVIAYAVFGEDLTARECERFIQKFHMENTGITVLGFDEKKKESPWWLWIWNDHAHLD